MFITFEGPEGSGKTTQIAQLASFLRRKGYAIHATREPGGTPIGDQIRNILADLKNQSMQPRSEILLFQASRAQLVTEVIRPHISHGNLVLCDRFADSTLAYQGYGHGTDLTILRQIIHFATDGLTPDLTLLLDIDPEIGLQRRANAGGWNRLDAYDLDFHQRVRAGYHQLAAEEPLRWVTINAEQPPDVVQSAVREAVLEKLATFPLAVKNREESLPPSPA